MPLLDHFHAPINDQCPWKSFHSSWVNEMVRQLNLTALPAGFVAHPHLELGLQVEPDVATIGPTGRKRSRGREEGGLATAVWVPSQPSWQTAVDWSDIDLFEVQVLREGGREVVAVIELVSPANKDRPAARRTFAAKCLSYLQQGVAVVLVDVVTERRANLHREMCELLEVDPGTASGPGTLNATAYRMVRRRKRSRLEAWHEVLSLGESLPTLPLWIEPDHAIPLDLEESYRSTCTVLRLGVAALERDG